VDENKNLQKVECRFPRYLTYLNFVFALSSAFVIIDAV
jgi:hypothetical protein